MSVNRRLLKIREHVIGAVGDGSGYEPRCNCSRCRRLRGEDLEEGMLMTNTCNGERTFTREELRQYSTGPVYLALKGVVFDVSSSEFYSPGGGYAALGGRDASRALATMSLDPHDVENHHVHDLKPKQLATLEQWVERMKMKYPIVGKLKE